MFGTGPSGLISLNTGGHKDRFHCMSSIRIPNHLMHDNADLNL
jgi:hypothetical protein